MPAGKLLNMSAKPSSKREPSSQRAALLGAAKQLLWERG